MAYTLANLRTDIRNYTEVDDGVLSDSVLDTIIKNAENRIYRESDSDDNRFYATSQLVTGNRYVTIPTDLRFSPPKAKYSISFFLILSFFTILAANLSPDSSPVNTKIFFISKFYLKFLLFGTPFYIINI